MATRAASSEARGRISSSRAASSSPPWLARSESVTVRVSEASSSGSSRSARLAHLHQPQVVAAGGEDGLEGLGGLAAQRAVGTRHLLEGADGAGMSLLAAEDVLEDVEGAPWIPQPREAQPAQAHHEVVHLLVAP